MDTKAAAVAAILAFAPISVGAQEFSANSMLPGCRAALPSPRGATAFDQGMLIKIGQCMGTMSTILFLQEDLSARIRSCMPRSVTIEQTIRVAIAYLDARPELLHHPFATLALASFRAAWPCQKR